MTGTISLPCGPVLIFLSATIDPTTATSPKISLHVIGRNNDPPSKDAAMQ